MGGPKGPEGAVGGVAYIRWSICLEWHVWWCISYLMTIWWIIDILKVAELKNGGHFVTVILTIEHDCMVYLSIRSLEVG